MEYHNYNGNYCKKANLSLGLENGFRKNSIINNLIRLETHSKEIGLLLDQITTTNDVAKKNLKSCKKLIERENLEPLEYIKKYESFGNHLSFLLLDDIETNPKNLENLEKIAKIYLDIANYIGDERIKQRASTIVNSINNLNIKK